MDVVFIRWLQLSHIIFLKCPKGFFWDLFVWGWVKNGWSRFISPFQIATYVFRQWVYKLFRLLWLWSQSVWLWLITEATKGDKSCLGCRRAFTSPAESVLRVNTQDLPHCCSSVTQLLLACCEKPFFFRLWYEPSHGFKSYLIFVDKGAPNV